MITLGLLRTDTGPATMGRLTIPGGATLYTLELPWKDNADNISCIPAGTYTLRRRFSKKHNCILFGIEGVDGRDDVEIHIGNFVKDTLGCVLVGTGREGWVVTHSADAFDRFMKAMEGIDEALIEITWATDLPVAA